MRVLIVEDNTENWDMLSRRLTRRGFETLRAHDGLAALDLVLFEVPQLILLDLNLPGIDGWEVARRLRADPATVSIPIIALTAHSVTGDRERALAAGCDEYETKPVDLTSLLAKIEAVTGWRLG